MVFSPAIRARTARPGLTAASPSESFLIDSSVRMTCSSAPPLSRPFVAASAAETATAGQSASSADGRSGTRQRASRSPPRWTHSWRDPRAAPGGCRARTGHGGGLPATWSGRLPVRRRRRQPDPGINRSFRVFLPGLVARQWTGGLTCYSCPGLAPWSFPQVSSGLISSAARPSHQYLCGMRYDGPSGG